MNIDGIILVRSASSRLKNKCFLKFGNESLLEHIIKRCIYFKINPIICTTKNKEDEKIINISKKNKIRFFAGSAKNKILRISDCCRKHKIKAFHTIDADDPFFCGLEVRKSFSLLSKGYQIIKPSKSSASGGASVGFSAVAEIFHEISKNLKKNEDTEMMWNFFKISKKKIKTKTLPNQKHHIKNCRLTLDYYEDYIFLKIIRDLLGNNASRKSIYNLISKMPELSKINFFRNDEWRKNQLK